MVSVSLCMIVKNEEDVLERCLESAADLGYGYPTAYFRPGAVRDALWSFHMSMPSFPSFVHDREKRGGRAGTLPGKRRRSGG